ncbi:MAG: T9SS type A sorting domain-containing protein [Crocinitomicaceae bacterium]
MKNTFTFLVLMLSQIGMAQHDTLAINQVWANINASGAFFTSPMANRAGYEVPNLNGMGPKLIYASSFWFGAVDQNMNIHLSTTGFASSMYPGPIATNYTSVNYVNRYNHVYSVTSSEIQTHQQNWNNPNYTIPADILNWPGNGDANNGEAAILAPFVDYNANNIYEPNLGDHPVIRGDKTLYFIMNDLAEQRDSSQALPLGLEYHFMTYQYARSGFLDSTTFVNVKVVNRSQDIYNQFIVANYADFDIGGSLDDLVGCSSSRNMMFGYNGDNIDDGSSGGAALFGVNPPVCGVKLLSHTMDASAYYSNGGAGSNSNTHLNIWNNINGNWGDGSSFTLGGYGYGGTIPTNYIFDGNPNDTSLWTDQNPNDRRAFIASESSDNFMPGDYKCYDFAILYSRTGGNSLLNVNGLFDVADSAQTFYDSQSYFYCEPLLLGESEIDIESNYFSIFPNPAQSEFRIKADGAFNVAIYDITGKMIQKEGDINQNQSIATPKNSGIYLVEITQNGISSTKKLIVQ